MRKTILVLLGTAGAVAGLAAPASAVTFSVANGGAITARSSTSLAFLNGPLGGPAVTCTGSVGSGSMPNGTGLPGAGIGRLTALSFTGCTGGGLAFTVVPKFGQDPNPSPWLINPGSYSNGVTTGTLSQISIHLAGPSCAFDLDGTGGAGTNTGVASLTYANATGVLALSGLNNTLTAYNTTGCLALGITNGRNLALKGNDVLKNTAGTFPGITSP